MRKKILAVVTAGLIGLYAAGCTSYQQATNMPDKGTSFGGGYFTSLTEWDSGGVRGQHCYIVYANDTKVKYLVTLGDVTSGITPLYNADGTLQVYGR